ncbi:MAG: type II CRISPR RNA-guided endonuclease Cas9, partial [Oscillospiraceae bacterium]
TFFDRLDESFLHADDRNSPQPYILFNDPQYDEKSYYAQFPTIYHLRQRLVEDPSKADIRLVYLALHHIIKYRGNFLYEGQSLAGGIDLQSAVLNVLQSLPQMEEVDIQTIETMSYEIAKVIKDKEIFKKDKKKSIAALLKLDKEDKDVAANIAAALVGSKINVKKLFKIEDGEELSLSLADEGAYDKVDGVLDDGQQATFDAMMQAYSAAVLCSLLSSSDGGTTFNNISQAMVEKFIQHKRDLKEIKGLFRKYELMEKYNDFFKNESKEGYAQYITQAGKCGYDKLKTSINAAFAKVKTEPDVAKMLEQVENDNFLLKINSKENGAIPYQLNLQELESILNSQGKYYPTLKENTEKIISILKYKIPYYVGPLSTQPSRFNWMERKAQGEIYPWNFDEIIDKDGSAEKFINRMRNKCTYLYNEETLPKCSLLYSEYEVRSEIKQIKLDDNFLCQELQNDLYEE